MSIQVKYCLLKQSIRILAFLRRIQVSLPDRLNIAGPGLLYRLAGQYYVQIGYGGKKITKNIFKMIQFKHLII